MIGFAYVRLAAGESLPGVIPTSNEQSIGAAIEDILMIVLRAIRRRDCTTAHDCILLARRNRSTKYCLSAHDEAAG